MRVAVEVIGSGAEEVSLWLLHFLGAHDALDPHLRTPFSEGGGMFEVETEGPNRYLPKPDPVFSILVSAHQQEDALAISAVAVRVKPFHSVFHRLDVLDADEISAYCENIARDLCFMEGGAHWLIEHRECTRRACGLA